MYNRLEISLSNFKKCYPIGKGGFGRVWKVRTKNKKCYAMKEISKAKIFFKNSVRLVVNERNILSALHFPLLANLEFAFESKENLYLVMDYLSGGDLRYMLNNKTSLSEKESKFAIACIILALEYIHKKGIIHRDLKPENLVFDSKGYLHLTDFGIAERCLVGKLTADFGGTVGYMAPEVLCRKAQDFSSDYYSLGVIAFEMMYGEKPFEGRTSEEIKDQVLSKDVHIRKLPQDWDEKAADFVEGLLKRKRPLRLGYKGIENIKQHPWLSDINWDSIKEMKENSPFYFVTGENFDSRNARKKDAVDYHGQEEEYLNFCNTGRYFTKFYFDRSKDKEKKENQNSLIHLPIIRNQNISKVSEDLKNQREERRGNDITSNKSTKFSSSNSILNFYLMNKSSSLKVAMNRSNIIDEKE